MGQKQKDRAGSRSFALPFFICLAIFLLMAYLYSTPAGKAFDLAVIRGVQGLESAQLTELMIFLSWAGTGKVIYPLTAVAALAFIFMKRPRLALLMAAGVPLGAGGLNHLLKIIFTRARPDIHRIVEMEGYSFPSGHAMNAAVFFALLAFGLLAARRGKKGRAAIFLFALPVFLIGLSRVYLGVHYPTDIIGGYAAGLAWVFLCISLYRAIK